MIHSFASGRVARVLATLAMAATPLAMAWTDKPVKVLVPAPAGGTIDIGARIIADQLAADIGQPVIIDNKPGAVGAIAVQAMNSAPADGQTIMVTVANILTESPHVMKTAFDPLKDVRPVVAFARSSLVLIVAPTVPASDVKGLVAWGKANPGKVSFATYSAGTASHYAGEIFNHKAGLDFQHVPFAGSPPALQQVMGSQIPVMFDGTVTTLPQARAGKVKVLGIAAKARSPLFPDAPTLAEQGFPEIDFSNWLGVIVNANMAPAMVDKINAAFTKAAAAPKVRERLAAAGFDAVAPLSSAQLTQSVKEDYDRNAAIVKQFNIKLN